MGDTRSVTIYDVAQLAGVSPRTVTRAFQKDAPINGDTRRRILEIAERTGYSPNLAASRIRGRELVIGVVCTNKVEAFTSELLCGFREAEEQLKSLKTRVLYRLCADADEETERLCSLANEGVDGLVRYSPFPIRRQAAALLGEKRLPCVNVCFETDGPSAISSISVDTDLKGRLLCSMLSLLCPGGRVAVFTGDRSTQHHLSTLRGFLAEAADCGLTVEAVYDTKDDARLAADMARDLLDNHPCDGAAFTSANSCAAIEVFCEREAGLRIIGADVFPQLSEYIRSGVVTATIYQNPKKQSRMALLNMYRHLAEGRELPERLLITPQIVLKSNLSVYTSDVDNRY